MKLKSRADNQRRLKTWQAECNTTQKQNFNSLPFYLSKNLLFYILEKVIFSWICVAFGLILILTKILK